MCNTKRVADKQEAMMLNGDAWAAETKGGFGSTSDGDGCRRLASTLR